MRTPFALHRSLYTEHSCGAFQTRSNNRAGLFCSWQKQLSLRQSNLCPRRQQVAHAGPTRPQPPKGNRNNPVRKRPSNQPRGSQPQRPRPQRPQQPQLPPQPQPTTSPTSGEAPPKSRRAGRQSSDEPPINSDITYPEVRVLSEKKEMIGVLPIAEALSMAEKQDVDLVLLNPDVEPPLTRLVELNKLKYEAAKADKDQRKKQRESRQELKELKFRPNTDVHDYNVRLKNAKRFLSKGDKVKLTMQFKGREMDFKNLGREMFQRFVEDLGEEASVAQDPAVQGYSMTLIVTPSKK